MDAAEYRHIKQLMYEPTSGAAMEELAQGMAPIYLYRDLKKMDKLPARPFFLLYETSPNYGHWVLITDTPEGIEHFDSYGFKPDGELSFVPLMYRAQSGQASPHLVRLLLDTGLPISFSDAKLQGKGRIATCGRWCLIRLMFSDMKSADFIKMIERGARKHNVSNDFLAVMLTEPPAVVD